MNGDLRQDERAWGTPLRQAQGRLSLPRGARDLRHSSPIEGEEGGPLPRPFAESNLSEAEGLRVTEGNGDVR